MLDRRFVATVALPAAIVTVTAVAVVVMLPSLPDPVATHFGLQGHADGYLSRSLVVPVLLGLHVAITALLAAVIHRSGPAVVGERLLVALPAAIAAMVGGVLLMTIEGQRDLADATQALFSASMPTVPLVAALLAGGLAVAIAPASRPPASATAPPPADAPRVSLQAGAVWQGVTPTALPMQIAAVVVVIASGVLWFLTAPFVGGITLASVVPLVGSTRFTVAIGPGGIVVRGVLGWPRVHVPLQGIEQARIDRLRPLAFGGWGLRLRGRQTAIVTRHGPALEIVRTDGASLLISMDSPEVPAGVLNSLLDVRVAATGDADAEA